MSIALEDVPHEAGYFMLWELSISDDDEGEQIIPIFVNENFVFPVMNIIVISFATSQTI